MSGYFPMNGFKATVCASTGDNRHKSAPTRWHLETLTGRTHDTSVQKDTGCVVLLLVSLGPMKRRKWAESLQLNTVIHIKNGIHVRPAKMTVQLYWIRHNLEMTRLTGRLAPRLLTDVWFDYWVFLAAHSVTGLVIVDAHCPAWRETNTM